jgi:hypothetical protein
MATTNHFTACRTVATREPPDATDKAIIELHVHALATDRALAALTARLDVLNPPVAALIAAAMALLEAREGQIVTAAEWDRLKAAVENLTR